MIGALDAGALGLAPRRLRSAARSDLQIGALGMVYRSPAHSAFLFARSGLYTTKEWTMTDIPTNAASRFATIQDALNRLEDGRDDHWEGNVPSLDAVAALTGFSVERRELNKFGRRRIRTPVVPSAAPDVPTITVDEATAAAAATARAVIAARERHRAAIANVRTTRAALGDATTDFLRQFPKKTPLENQRDFQKREQQNRADAAAGLAPEPARPTPGPAFIDALASGSRGGSVDRRVGSEFRRGAFPMSKFGQRA
jgi:hypothetical protein